MTPEASLRRLLLASVAGLLLLFVLLAGWFFTRRVTPGEFVVRVAPTAAGARSFQLSVRGPGGGMLGLWGFQDVPSPAILAGLQQKVPWKAVSTHASADQPCVTLETTFAVPEATLAPVEGLLFAQCCPGLTDVARCPVRRVVRNR